MDSIYFYLFYFIERIQEQKQWREFYNEQFFSLINIDVRTRLRVSWLVPRVLKLTIM